MGDDMTFWAGVLEKLAGNSPLSVIVLVVGYLLSNRFKGVEVKLSGVSGRLDTLDAREAKRHSRVRRRAAANRRRSLDNAQRLDALEGATGSGSRNTSSRWAVDEDEDDEEEHEEH